MAERELSPLASYSTCLSGIPHPAGHRRAGGGSMVGEHANSASRRRMVQTVSVAHERMRSRAQRLNSLARGCLNSLDAKLLLRHRCAAMGPR